MPPTAKRDVCIVLYDLNTKKNGNENLAMSTLQHLFVRKQFCVKRCPEYKLYLLGTEDHLNKMHYKHIREAGPFRTLDIKHLEEIEKVVAEACDGDGTYFYYNWLQALHLAATVLSEHCDPPNDKSLLSAQIYFVTDLQTPVGWNDESRSLARQVSSILKSYPLMYVYVLGPFDCGPSKTLSTLEDVEKWRLAVPFLETKRGDDVDFKVMAELVTKNQVLVADPHIGVPLSNVYKASVGMADTNEDLLFGSLIHFRTWVRRLICKPPNSPPSDAQDSPKKHGFSANNFVEADDVSVEVDAENVVDGIKVDDKFVPLENDMFQILEDRSFHVLGFVKSAAVPEEHYYNEETYRVFQKQHIDPAFACLVDAMIDERVFALARRKYLQQRFPPKFGVLVPVRDPRPHFLFKYLPFADDIALNYTMDDRRVTDADVRRIEKEAAHRADVSAYLDAIDVTDRVETMPLDVGFCFDPNVDEACFALLQEPPPRENTFLKAPLPEKVEKLVMKLEAEGTSFEPSQMDQRSKTP